MSASGGRGSPISCLDPAKIYEKRRHDALQPHSSQSRSHSLILLRLQLRSGGCCANMLALTQPVAQIWSLPVALIHCIFILPIRRPLISSQSSQSVFPPTLSLHSLRDRIVPPNEHPSDLFRTGPSWSQGSSDRLRLAVCSGNDVGVGCWG